jgi:hypothetical protein
MAKEILQYNLMVESALRAVVRQAVAEVAESGLPGKHHFYITFRTTYPGVELPDYLRARYPAEMTIVLQFQFYDLVVTDTGFSVTLTFNNSPERLVIPFRAITVFADPSVNFALPFQPVEPTPMELLEAPAKLQPAKPVTPATAMGKTLAPVATTPKPAAEAADKSGEVVSLDHFRRK